MSVYVSCDYCGAPVEDGDLSIEITATGYIVLTDCGASSWGRDPIGHYHSEPQAGQPSCYRRMLDAIDLTHDAGPSLETIETATPQWVAAQRRKFREPGD